MIEVTLLEYLKENASADVYMERPEKKPTGKYIMLERTGSSRKNYIITSTFAVQSYAPSLYEAARLNEEVKDLMYNSIALDGISGVRLNSDYNYTDTATKQPRYQAVFAITHY